MRRSEWPILVRLGLMHEISTGVVGSTYIRGWKRTDMKLKTFYIAGRLFFSEPKRERKDIWDSTEECLIGPIFYFLLEFCSVFSVVIQRSQPGYHLFYPEQQCSIIHIIREPNLFVSYLLARVCRDHSSTKNENLIQMTYRI